MNDKNTENVKNIFERHGIKIVKIGKTADNKELIIKKGSDIVIRLGIDKLKEAWTTGLVEAMK